LQRVFDVPLVI
jgi:tryptophanyl-tRNA synthetase